MAGLEGRMMELLASGNANTPGLAEFAKSIHQLLNEEMKPKVLANLASQQAQVDELINAFSRCPASLAVAKNDALKGLAQFTKLSKQHKDCRSSQNSFATREVTPGILSGGKKKECDNLQGQMDAYSCGYVADLAAACAALDSCYSHSLASYDLVVKAARDQEGRLKTEMTAILHVLCLSQVFNVSNEEDGRRDAAIQACKVADYATKLADFVLRYPSAPSKASCTVPTDGAGSPSYKQAQYTSLAANAPAQACTATCCQDDVGLLAYCPANYDRRKRMDCVEFKKSPDYTNRDAGIRQIACLLTGCCWQPLEAGSQEPWCFLSPKLSKTYTTRSCSERKLKDEGICRRCQTGMACGNSCIEKRLTCDRQMGCACDDPLDEATRLAVEAAKMKAEQEDARQQAPADRLAKASLDQQEAAEQEKIQATRTLLQELRAEIVKDPSMNAAKLADELAAKATKLEGQKAQQLSELVKVLVPQLISRPSEVGLQLLSIVAEAGATLQGQRVQGLLDQERLAQAAAEAKKLEEKKARELLEPKLKAARLAEEQLKLQLQTAPGKVTVVIISGDNFPNSDPFLMGSKPDAFAALAVGCEHKITPRVDNSNSPRWNWRGAFDVARGISILTIDIYDYDVLGDTAVLWGSLGSHDLLGSVKVNFRDLEPNKEATFTKPMGTSSITFSVLWSPAL